MKFKTAVYEMTKLEMISFAVSVNTYITRQIIFMINDNY